MRKRRILIKEFIAFGKNKRRYYGILDIYVDHEFINIGHDDWFWKIFYEKFTEHYRLLKKKC